MTGTSPLERAAASGDDRTLLAALLEAWRARRLVETEELIALVSARIDRGREPLGTNQQGQREWSAIEAAGDPGDVPRLLAALSLGKAAVARAQLALVAKWPADPRAVPALWRLVVERPLVSHRPFWTQLFRELRHRADATLIPPIDQLLAAPTHATFDVYRKEQLARLRRELADRAPPAPTDEERRLLARLAAQLGRERARGDARTADDFLADIWADPADDGVRQVFADWLSERGDLRGELITLQMARAAGRLDAKGTRRECELLAQHGREWLGPLAPAVEKGGMRFERGFLYACRVNWRGLLASPGLVTHPAWSTVREYSLDDWADPACDAFLDHMIALGAKRR